MSCAGYVYKSNHQQTQQDIIFLIYNNILTTKIEEKASGSLMRFQILSLCVKAVLVVYNTMYNIKLKNTSRLLLLGNLESLFILLPLLFLTCF